MMTDMEKNMAYIEMNVDNMDMKMEINRENSQNTKEKTEVKYGDMI